MKACWKCKKSKPASQFAKDRSRKDGLQGHCRKCKYAFEQERRKKHPGGRAEQSKRYDPRRYFGITLEQYDIMSETQGNVCAICGGINPNGKRLAVDHDHKTGKIRGLLCSKCNLALGNIKEQISILRSMENYIKRFNKIEV